MPKICRECKQIGHITDTFGNGPHCGICSNGHEERLCKRTPFCINCGGGHPPLDKICPTYVQEKAIIKIQTDVNIAPKRARKQYMAKAKVRYIPLPAERSADSGSDSASEEDPEEKTEPTDNNNNTEKSKAAPIPSTSTDHVSPSQTKGTKRKSQLETKAGKAPKRRSARRTSTTEQEATDVKHNNNEIIDEDDDDFILDAKREALRRALKEDGDDD